MRPGSTAPARSGPCWASCCRSSGTVSWSSSSSASSRPGEFLLALTLMNDADQRTLPVFIGTATGGVGGFLWPRIAALYIMAILPGLVVFASPSAGTPRVFRKARSKLKARSREGAKLTDGETARILEPRDIRN